MRLLRETLSICGRIRLDPDQKTCLEAALPLPPWPPSNVLANQGGSHLCDRSTGSHKNTEMDKRGQSATEHEMALTVIRAPDAGLSYLGAVAVGMQPSNSQSKWYVFLQKSVWLCLLVAIASRLASVAG